MRILLGYVTVVAGMAGSCCWGQGLFDQLNFRNAENAGFGVYGASLFYGYTGYGESATGQPPSTMNYGGNFSVGWQHHQMDTNSSILYSGTYGGLVQYPQFNAYSQSLSLSASTKIAPKWTGTISASGEDYSLSESLFQPSSLSVTSQIVSSFNDLAAAFGLGTFSTSQIQSLYQNAYLESAVRSGLLGGRFLSYGGQASLNYAPSPHVNVHFDGFTAGGERLNNSQDTTVQPNYVMPRSLGGDVGIAVSHTVSARTQVGFDLSETFIHNRYQEATVSTGTGSFGRKMGTRWFLRMYGGGSYSRYLQQSYAQPDALQAVGGGSLGFQMVTHTLTATYSRTAASANGFSVGTNTNLMASWSWHRTGSGFTLFSSFGQEQQRNTGFLSMSGWQAAGGFSEALGGQTSVSVQYVYLDTTERYPGNQYKLTTNSVRVSLRWSPQRLRR